MLCSSLGTIPSEEVKNIERLFYVTIKVVLNLFTVKVYLQIRGASFR